MGFSPKQIRALRRDVHPDRTRTRTNNGKTLLYIEGWHAITEANRIFGFDGWDRETLETRCIQNRETRDGPFSATYIAKVRVTVRVGDALVKRDGHGSGEARGSSVGEAHDLAIKAAETDGTKRALATFGKPFGLALYANGRWRRGETASTNAAATVQTTKQPEDFGSEATNSEKSVGLIAPPRSEPLPVKAQAANDSLVMPKAGPMPRVDKSLLKYGEPRRVRNKLHLRYVASQPCLLCSTQPSDPHHLRFAQPRALGRKVSDEFTVPLCRKHHRDLHRGGDEIAWWHDMGVEPLSLAQELWAESADAK